MKYNKYYMSPKQVDSNGNSFIVNEFYDMVDKNLPQEHDFLTMRVRYLGCGIPEATTNPNFVGNGLDRMYENMHVFQEEKNPGGPKIPISRFRDENNGKIFIRHYPGSIQGGSTRKTRCSRKRLTRRFRI